MAPGSLSYYIAYPLFISSTKKRHIRDIVGRTNFFCHTYDTSMTIIVTKPGIIIDVVGSYFYDIKWAFLPGRAGDAAG